METIRFEDVSFTYPLGQRPALQNLSLTIHPGEFVVICGKSGCGKSTFLRQIKKELTLYGRTEGQVLYEDVPIAQLPPRKSAAAFGFVMQNPDSQLVTDKVWHELAFGLENLGLPCSTIKRRVAEMASYFGILDIRREVCELSGGQKQLLNLASVMAMQPEVLLLDEPTSQLDPIAASDFLQTIYRINRELGTTVILSEHRLEEAFPLADRVLVLDGGRLTAWGTPREVACILQSWPAGPHPVYKGMPAVMRIFENAPPPPLTLREGRLRLEKMLTDRELPPRPGSVRSLRLLPGRDRCGAAGCLVPVSAGQRAGAAWAFSADTAWRMAGPAWGQWCGKKHRAKSGVRRNQAPAGQGAGGRDGRRTRHRPPAVQRTARTGAPGPAGPVHRNHGGGGTV